MSRIVIRVDSGSEIGSGHLMRTLTLAQALRERGASVCFICRERAGCLDQAITTRGFHLVKLRARACAESDEGRYASWLGAPWPLDADETRDAIGGLGWRPTWLIVDHYAIDHRWESVLRPSVDRIMAIDDLGDRNHDCDLLLDQNLVAERDERYAGKLPAACATLLGPEFALLQPDYAQLHPRMPVRAGAVRRILIYFGANDQAGLTRRALDAALQASGPEVALEVILGSSRAADAHLEPADRRVTVHHQLHSLAALIARADLCIGAAGATSWERLCLGLPALVVTRAQNQRPIAAELHRRGLIQWLGDEEEVTGSQIEQAIRVLIEAGLDAAWSNRCLEFVDGCGAVRVCDTMLFDGTEDLRVRHATPRDEGLLLLWANDADTRRSGFSAEQIAADTHHQWFDRRLRNVEGCHMYIVATQRGTPVGQVRFEWMDGEWESHYALGRAFRGRGLGRLLLRTALEQLRLDVGPVSVRGRVKVSNHASAKIFLGLGFAAQPESPGVTLFRRKC